MAKAADAVKGIAAPIAERLGLTIWDVRYVKEGASWFLRIFIDKDGGVGIDDCEAFSRAIDKPLDDAEIISESYFLEVSSPGLNRSLTRLEHFERYKGFEIAVKLIRPIDGEKLFFGTLQDASDGEITISDLNCGSKSFKINEAAKICLCDDKDLI